MNFVYNFLQIIVLVILFPVLLLLICIKKKYRSRIIQRLGFGLHELCINLPVADRKTIWIHALSVGEVTSALPLIRGLKNEMDDICIVFSVSTKTGAMVAEKNIRPFVDVIIPAPLDLLFTVNRFIHCIHPDLFILVETDFWPNWLFRLKQNNVPLILVNGRISKKSFATYRRFHFLFTPLFRTFSLLSMQTNLDGDQLVQLDVPKEKIITLGNLKYDTALWPDPGNKALEKSDLLLAEDNTIWICGSTHRGEEEILLRAFSQIQKTQTNLVLIIAPRDPGRSGEIIDIATSLEVRTSCRTTENDPGAPVLILDTIGELTRCYNLAKVAFIGGSLVQQGGHNPLEAAVHGVPVFFGPHMEDFQEIARDCMLYKAGLEIHSTDEITAFITKILHDDSLHVQMSQAARQLVDDKSGVVANHVEIVGQLLKIK